MKPFSKKPALKTPDSAAAGRIQSGVQLSRQALYLERMNQIYADVQAGRCDFEAAVERVVEAAVARSYDRFTPRGREVLAARLREECMQDLQLRRTLGG
jgi:hypothetical protein